MQPVDRTPVAIGWEREPEEAGLEYGASVSGPGLGRRAKGQRASVEVGPSSKRKWPATHKYGNRLLIHLCCAEALRSLSS